MATFNSQIENRNFLSPIGYKLLLAKFPKVSYFCQSANIPAMTLGEQRQSTPLRSLPLEGFIEYDPFNIAFIIDEDLENYMILHNWMRGLGTPDTTMERYRFKKKMAAEVISERKEGAKPIYGDATLVVMNSNFQANFNVVFTDIFPTSLSALEFNATVDGTEYAMATVTFRYTSYEVRSADVGTRIDKLT